MMTEARRTWGRRPSVSDDDIKAMLAKGMSGAAIGRHVGLTQQAINQRIKRIREEAAGKAEFLLPWAVKQAHATGYVHRAVLAYAHRQRGEALSPRARTELAALEEFLHEHDAVVTYDYNQGWQIRNRRPDDGRRLVV